MRALFLLRACAARASRACFFSAAAAARHSRLLFRLAGVCLLSAAGSRLSFPPGHACSGRQQSFLPSPVPVHGIQGQVQAWQRRSSAGGSRNCPTVLFFPLPAGKAGSRQQQHGVAGMVCLQQQAVRQAASM